jgi:uncharacterized protein (DUF1330 family)
MPAYLVFIREGAVKDADAMAQYSKTAREAGGDVKVKPLVAYGAIEPVEGEAADGLVVLQFDTTEEAKAWYNRPGYLAAVPHRQKGADYRVMLVQGL